MDAEPRTKIIATLGDPEARGDSPHGTYKNRIHDNHRNPIPTPTLEDLVELLLANGVDVLRLNAAHVETATLSDKYRRVKQAILAVERRRRSSPVGLLVDLPGPKIRFRNDFILPSETLTVGFFDGPEEIAPPTEVPAEDPPDVPRSATARILLGDEAFGTAAPEVARTILDSVRQRCASNPATPLLAFVGDNDATLTVESVDDQNMIRCRIIAVKDAGDRERRKGIGHRKGFTIRGIPKEIPAFTPEDAEKLRTILAVDHEEGATPLLSHIGLSFCQSRDDVRAALFHSVTELRRLSRFADMKLEDLLTHVPLLIAKIETEQGYRNLDSILDLADGVMIARGDLALEMETVLLPECAKAITTSSNLRGKPVIMATQMLESMKLSIECARPEATDVFTAVADGADALLLSGETSTGKYPGLAVAKMRELAARAETFLTRRASPEKQITEYFEKLRQSAARVDNWRAHWEEIDGIYTRMDFDNKISREEYLFLHELCKIKRQRLLKQDSTDRISHAACILAADAEALVCPTTSGRTARMLARFRPTKKMLALPHDQIVARKLALSWGVEAIDILPVPNRGDGLTWLMNTCGSKLKEHQQRGPVIFTCGSPLMEVGTTNMVLRWDEKEIPG